MLCTQQCPHLLWPRWHFPGLMVTFHRPGQALPSSLEASVATSLVYSSLIRSQIFKLTSSQGEQAGSGHRQTGTQPEEMREGGLQRLCSLTAFS